MKMDLNSEKWKTLCSFFNRYMIHILKCIYYLERLPSLLVCSYYRVTQYKFKFKRLNPFHWVAVNSCLNDNHTISPHFAVDLLRCGNCRSFALKFVKERFTCLNYTSEQYYNNYKWVNTLTRVRCFIKQLYLFILYSNNYDYYFAKNCIAYVEPVRNLFQVFC